VSGTGQPFQPGIVKHIRHGDHLRSLYARLRARGLLTRDEMADRLKVSADTVKDLGAARPAPTPSLNDKDECLYEPPGSDAPSKCRVDDCRIADGPTSSRIRLMRCSMKRSPSAMGRTDPTGPLRYPASDSLAEPFAVDRVAIAQQPTGRRVIRKRFNHLLRGPSGRRIVEVNDPSAVMPKDDEDEQDATRDGRHGEEIQRAQRRDVIREEGLPCLRRRARRPPHQSGDGSLRDLNAQLTQLAVDSRSAPERIRSSDLHHECTNGRSRTAIEARRRAQPA
jgi:hypothetical protein